MEKDWGFMRRFIRLFQEENRNEQEAEMHGKTDARSMIFKGKNEQGEWFNGSNDPWERQKITFTTEVTKENSRFKDPL